MMEHIVVNYRDINVYTSNKDFISFDFAGSELTSQVNQVLCDSVQNVGQTCRGFLDGKAILVEYKERHTCRERQWYDK